MKYDKWLNEQGIDKIKTWARIGLTDKQIASKMGVAYSTFREWRSKSPEMAESLQHGKDLADAKVERSLFEKANGYTYIEKRTTKQGDITKTEIWERHSPADTTAIIYWLKNRKPLEWRDRKEPPDTLPGELNKVDELLAGIQKIAEEKLEKDTEESDELTQ